MGWVCFVKGGKKGGFKEKKADVFRKGGYSRKMAAFRKLSRIC